MLGVVDPVVKKALEITKTQHIGVIGTRATINSGVYEKKIREMDSKIEVCSASCPLFVPLVEEGLTSIPAAKLIAQDYLNNLSLKDIDTLILGCTHYPLLKDTIQEVVGEKVVLVDSAEPTAKELKRMLAEKNKFSNNPHPTYEFYLTDAPERAQKVAEHFFGKHLPGELRKISL